jgi:large subunit ribosomal protein L13e
LSTRQKKAKAKPAPKAKAARERPKRPAGKAPEAMVSSRNGTDMIVRLGKGFSMGELDSAGLPPRLASKWGLRLDSRRRSVLQGNVDSLKGWGSHAGLEKRAVGAAVKIEEELEKVEEEVKEEVVKAEKEVKKEAVKVEKEAVKVEKEAVKVEKGARKEAGKAEKAVKAKLEKPKAKKKKVEA